MSMRNTNRVVNLGISSDDMLVRLDGLLDEKI